LQGYFCKFSKLLYDLVLFGYKANVVETHKKKRAHKKNVGAYFLADPLYTIRNFFMLYHYFSPC